MSALEWVLSYIGLGAVVLLAFYWLAKKSPVEDWDDE